MCGCGSVDGCVNVVVCIIVLCVCVLDVCVGCDCVYHCVLCVCVCVCVCVFTQQRCQLELSVHE